MKWVHIGFPEGAKSSNQRERKKKGKELQLPLK
jgi:hypothetical protein